jgi:hypothetical protein
MAFCTLLERDGDFPFDRYQEMNTRAGAHDSLPDACIVRASSRRTNVVPFFRRTRNTSGLPSGSFPRRLLSLAAPVPRPV